MDESSALTSVLEAAQSEATAADAAAAAALGGATSETSGDGGAAQAQQQATSGGPPNEYAKFREMLKHPSAQPIIAQIRTFVMQFPGGLNRHDAARRVHNFLSRTQEQMMFECVVFAAEADDEGRNNTAEGLEKFVIIKLHNKLFASEPGDPLEDAALHRQIAGLRWVDFKNLGVPAVDRSLLGLAVNELRRIEDWKAPRDKLVCILNACRVINDVLKRSVEESGEAARPLSADDFLPLLIFAVIAANPLRLHSNLEFVAAFRHPTRLVAEDAYFLTALQSAVAFVKETNPKALDVSAEEYDRLIQASLAAYDSEKRNSDAGAGDTGEDKADDLHGSTTANCMPKSPATAAEKAAELPPAVRQALQAKVQDLSLSLNFQSVQSARQLRVSDLSRLLQEYQELAALLRAVERGSLEGLEG